MLPETKKVHSAEKPTKRKGNRMKYSALKFIPILVVAGLFLLTDGLRNTAHSVSPPLGLAGKGSTGEGGYELTISAELTPKGAVGHTRLIGGATGPVVQVVPPSEDQCGCWCINVQRTDTDPLEGDQRVNWYIRDTGDGKTTFDEISFITSIGGDCSTFSTEGLFFIPLVQGDFKAH
jgi:hypothetical protein